MERNFCLLIIFTCNLLGSESFWFSYKAVTQNKIIIYEERNISPSMHDSQINTYKQQCKIDFAKKDSQLTIDFLNEHFDHLIACFYPMSTQVHNKTLFELEGMSEKSILTVTPTKFTVDFKDEFANINVLR